MNESKIEETEIDKAVTAALSQPSLPEAVRAAAQVMQMICDTTRERGTTDRNRHPAIRRCLDHLSALCSSARWSEYSAYAELADRAERGDAMAKKYLGAMDACNLSGVLFSFSNDMRAIEAEAEIYGESVSDSPIAISVVDKLQQLSY